MRPTGIVRRIDELGRIVVPKELRRTLRIREGDSVEIYVDENGNIVLRKYSPVGQLKAMSHDMAERWPSRPGWWPSFATRTWCWLRPGLAP